MGKKKITREMTFDEIMELDSEAGRKLGEKGLFCGGCPMAAFETLEDGAAMHGVDVDQLLVELNEEEGVRNKEKGEDGER